MKFKIEVMPKTDVLDPQGVAVEKALSKMNFSGLTRVRIGKSIEVEVTGTDAAKAEQDVKSMAQKLLCNANVETFKVTAL